MNDLIKRLRDTPCNREPFTDAHADCQCRVANAAADKIEKLQTVLTEHNQWHLGQTDECEYGFVPAEEYCDSTLFERTTAALGNLS